jgi:flagellar basal-body rod protein FlgC
VSSFKALDISASAMHAQTVRLNTISSNLANADSVAKSEDEAYKSKQPLFSEVMEKEVSGIAKGGVKVDEVVQSKAPAIKEYSPNHPMADEKGYIYRSNVNKVEEMANMISASRSYETNIEVMNTSKQLLLRTIQLGK